MPAASDADLLPWIMGGLAAAAGAAALFVTVESPRHGHMPTIAAAAPIALPALAAPATPATPAPTAGRDFPAGPAAPAAPMAGRDFPAAPAAQVPAGAAPPLPPGEVWQCTVNGQPVFSDAPCGKDSSIRQLKETNLMDPSPMLPYWAYERPDAGYPSAPAEPPMAQPYDPDSTGDSYAVTPYGLAYDRSRRGHEPRRPHHERGSPDRK